MFEYCHTLFALEELAAYTYIYLHVHISAQGACVARRRLLTYADVCCRLLTYAELVGARLVVYEALKDMLLCGLQT